MREQAGNTWGSSWWEPGGGLWGPTFYRQQYLCEKIRAGEIARAEKSPKCEMRHDVRGHMGTKPSQIYLQGTSREPNISR